jgi:hypothetical protein
LNWLTQAQWALVADAYTPVLVIVWLLALIHAARVPEFPARKHLLACVVSVAWVYLWMFADQWLSLWPRFGLDYSTHTAFALVFVMALAGFSRVLMWLAVGSLLLYMTLMWFLGYHTWPDMLSTVLVIGPIHYWVGRSSR